MTVRPIPNEPPVDAAARRGPGRVPPHNLEAEESLLGAMLLSIDAVRSARRAGVTVADFYKPAHGHVYDAVLELHDHGAPIDPVTVAEELRRHDLLDALGGRVTLLRLQGGTPASANASHYASIVVDLAVRRRLVMLAGDVAELGYDDSQDLADVLERVHLGVDALDRPTGVSEPPRDLNEFIASGDVTPDWLIPGLVERQDRVLLTGGEGRGKSLFMRAFAVCAAAGLHPFNRAPTRPTPTLLVECESSERIMRGWLAHYRELAMNDVLRVEAPLPDWSNLRVEARPGGMDLGTRGDRSWLEGLVRAASPRPELIAIGPLYQLTPEDLRDEAASNTVRAALNELVGEYRVALLVEAHSPYADDGQGNRLLRPYGSSVWSRWPEMGVGLRADPGGHAKVEHWRPARDERPWPRQLFRAPADGPIDWPWSDRPDLGRY